jgi:hypothetical protein
VGRDRPGSRPRVACRRGAEEYRCGIEPGAAGAHEVVDDGCRERERLVLHPRCARRARSDRELCGDRGPRGIRVAPGEVHAPQAGSGSGPHERPELGAPLVEHYREVGHVGGEPPQVRGRRHHP